MGVHFRATKFQPAAGFFIKKCRSVNGMKWSAADSVQLAKDKSHVLVLTAASPKGPRGFLRQLFFQLGTLTSARF